MNVAVANRLSAGREALRHAAPHVYEYYKDMRDIWEEEGEAIVSIGVTVSRRSSGDRAVYTSIECNCAWEPEHGLQLVFDSSMRVVKVGSYDGHLTNADAFDKKAYEGIVYISRSMLFGESR